METTDSEIQMCVWVPSVTAQQTDPSEILSPGTWGWQGWAGGPRLPGATQPRAAPPPLTLLPPVREPWPGPGSTLGVTGRECWANHCTDGAGPRGPAAFQGPERRGLQFWWRGSLRVGGNRAGARVQTGPGRGLRGVPGARLC